MTGYDWRDLKRGDMNDPFVDHRFCYALLELIRGSRIVIQNHKKKLQFTLLRMIFSM